VRGLPWSSTEDDLTGFFAEVNVYPLRLHRNQGSGEAFVEFASPAELQTAMQKNRAYMKGSNRYIELIPVPYAELAATVGLPPQAQHEGAGAAGGYAAAGPSAHAPYGASSGGYGAPSSSYGAAPYGGASSYGGAPASSYGGGYDSYGASAAAYPPSSYAAQPAAQAYGAAPTAAAGYYQQPAQQYPPSGSAYPPSGATYQGY
jgi:RNA recognition motif-containing protein